MASTYLSFTQGAATSRRIFTISVWVKRANLSAQQQIFETWLDNNNRFDVQFTASDKILVQHTLGGSTSINIETSRLFRDTSAWYHIVVEVDTTQATASDRVKIYINGSQETSLSPATYPSQNLDLALGTASYTNFLGKYSSAGGNYFDGSMSHVHFIDGTAYDATAFGEYDANGVWKIKTDVSVTYGTNGYFILKDGNSVTDQSGNGNNFTVAGGTLTNTEDNPSNVFCTMNPLDKSSSLALSNGNTTSVSPSDAWQPGKATIGMIGQSGKFYWEAKIVSGLYPYIGVYDASGTVRGSVQSDMDTNRFAYTYAGGIERTITGQSGIPGGTYATFGAGDIISVGVDKVNGTITFWKNGTQIYTETHSSLQTKDLIPGTQQYNSQVDWNFGNGYFGTTAVASAGTNASGIGIFEYDVPTGYTALSTKGLNL
jgi:hypothetical protein